MMSYDIARQYKATHNIMLETEEVDDDFFTPVSGTSLANIFGNAPKTNDKSENDSLKYVPPKPLSLIPKGKENEQIKSTECIFACALIGHEWCNNVYTSKGKIGFAIVKIQKTGIHNIILYDSNKTTLSSTYISKSLTITIGNNSYVSYYDNHQKYWSIYGTADEIKKICEILKSFGVNLNHESYGTDKGPPEPSQVEIKEQKHDTESLQESRESDTDSSVNRKTKASILNRMANMGHSVLPTRVQVIESSESTDENETVVQPKVAKHKSFKTLKKNTVETAPTEPAHLQEAHQLISTKTDSEILSVNSSQIMPISSVVTNNSNELCMFMTEQRISNSEMRININRIHDKIDNVVSKMNSLENRSINCNISTDILLKLLAEYESKIKTYEELLRSKGINSNNVKIDETALSNKNKEIELLTNKLTDMQIENKNNNLKISLLESEIKLLKDSHTQEMQNHSKKEIELQLQIDKLENDLTLKSKELIELSKSNCTESKINDNIQNKLKNIMNDAFQSISMNFESNDTYTGDNIKKIVGTVIKKITIEAINEL